MKRMKRRIIFAIAAAWLVFLLGCDLMMDQDTVITVTGIPAEYRGGLGFAGLVTTSEPYQIPGTSQYKKISGPTLVCEILDPDRNTVSISGVYNVTLGIRDEAGKQLFSGSARSKSIVKGNNAMSFSDFK